MSALLTVAAVAAELGVRPRWVTERIAAGAEQRALVPPERLAAIRALQLPASARGRAYVAPAG